MEKEKIYKGSSSYFQIFEVLLYEKWIRIVFSGFRGEI